MTRKALTILTLLLNYQSVIYAQTSEEEALARAFGDEDFISIATGSRQLLSLAPAVATVITAEDIKAIGATDLDQVLGPFPVYTYQMRRERTALYTQSAVFIRKATRRFWC